MIVVYAAMRAKAGKREELVRVLDAVRVEATDEPGTLVFAVHTVADDDATVVCYEAYRDEEAQAAHRAGAAFGDMVATVGNLLDGPATVTTLELVGSTGLALT